MVGAPHAGAEPKDGSSARITLRRLARRADRTLAGAAGCRSKTDPENRSGVRATSKPPRCGRARSRGAGARRSTVAEGNARAPGAPCWPGSTAGRRSRRCSARAGSHGAEAQVRLLQAGSRPEDIRQAEAQAEAARSERCRAAQVGARGGRKGSPSASSSCWRRTPAPESSETTRPPAETSPRIAPASAQSYCVRAAREAVTRTRARRPPRGD